METLCKGKKSFWCVCMPLSSLFLSVYLQQVYSYASYSAVVATELIDYKYSHTSLSKSKYIIISQAMLYIFITLTSSWNDSKL